MDRRTSAEDNRTIANRLAREEKREQEGEDESRETKLHKEDATLPVRPFRPVASLYLSFMAFARDPFSHYTSARRSIELTGGAV